MDSFYSLADMLEQYKQEGWQCESTGRGVKFIPPPEIGTGSMEVWGDPGSHCYVDSDVVFHKELVERYYFRERGIQISFIDDMSATYYQKKEKIASSNFGLFIYINNIPRPWFKRFYPGRVQKVSSFLLLETFIKTHAIDLDDNWWNRAAATINNGSHSIPELGLLCKKMRMTDVPNREFPLFLNAHVTEALNLLVDFLSQQWTKRDNELTTRSIKSAGRAIRILSDEYKMPPDIESLSTMVDIDKKTLQKAFRQIVGKSVGEYIRSIRIEKALTLLEDRKLSIEEISRQVGYLSKINFYKSFKRTFDCTPQEIRKVIRIRVV